MSNDLALWHDFNVSVVAASAALLGLLFVALSIHMRVLSAMEEQDAHPYHLSDEQVAEVERRLADPNPRFLTLEEVRERIARRHA